MIRLCGHPSLLVFSRQLYYTGFQSVGIVVLSAGLIGFGFVYAFQNSLEAVSGAMALELLALLSARSLGVVITGFVFVARSITAISSEIALLRVSGEWRTLERLGVDSVTYLLMPRVLASGVAVAFLSIYFFLAVVLAADFALSGRIDILSVERVVNSLQPDVVFSGFIRAGIFAALSVLWVLRFAVRSRRSYTGVPIGTSSAVLQATVLILALETIYQVATSQPVPG